ncbi:hypothetical protein FRX31_005659 [Thalictrum thalictroides]|uniref:Uncharacterized protein n=1 Tax=Thalictrum thalictroides TaxID=46969 RepID=A0A7J6X4Y7_THATH|nr:hypothetical protein FRX31_005659 [Thalictrum thalictroides]
MEYLTWSDLVVAFMMTQHTTLPNDVAALKEMTDRNLKSNFFCLLTQLKDVGGEIICRDDTKDCDLKKLKTHRDQLVKDNEMLEVGAQESEQHKKLKHDFQQFKEETAILKKKYEGQLVELQLKLHETEKKNIFVEAEKLALSTRVKQANCNVISLTARFKMAESKVSALDAELTKFRTENKTLTFAHDCVVKGMKEKLLQLETSITKKDKECEVWYRDTEAKSKVAVAEQVKAKVAGFMKTLQSKPSVSPSPPPPNL